MKYLMAIGLMVLLNGCAPVIAGALSGASTALSILNSQYSYGVVKDVEEEQENE